MLKWVSGKASQVKTKRRGNLGPGESVLLVSFLVSAEKSACECADAWVIDLREQQLRQLPHLGIHY